MIDRSHPLRIGEDKGFARFNVHIGIHFPAYAQLARVVRCCPFLKGCHTAFTFFSRKVFRADRTAVCVSNRAQTCHGIRCCQGRGERQNQGYC